MTPKANSSLYYNARSYTISHNIGPSSVTSQTREQMIQSQKDAALRRRKQQLRSSFIQSIRASETKSLDSNPHVIPTVRTYSFSSNAESVETSDGRRMSISNNEGKTDAAAGFETASDSEKSEKQLHRRRQFERSLSNVSSLNSFQSLSKSKSDDLQVDSNQHQATDEPNWINSIILPDESIIEVCSDDETEEESVCVEATAKPKNIWDNIDWSDVEELRKIVLAPCPKYAGLIKCYIRRSKGKSKLFPEYRVYLQDGDKFLMTSKKRAKKQSSNYLISVERNDHEKDSMNIIGKLRANFLGTEFQIYDNGKNPKHFDPFFDEKNDDTARIELGSILYSSNILGNRRPRKMQVCINRVNNEGRSTKKWQPACKEEEMIQNFKHSTKEARKHLYIYENRQPKWNEDIRSFVLNFNNRVKLASVKNFQLIDPDNDENIVMQFGKVSNDEFIMDVQWPMSLFQAFAVCLSSFDSKIACD